MYSTGDVSAIVCTLNSIASIEACLSSLRSAEVGQIIVVDGGSLDGTRLVAQRYADVLLDDPGLGLSVARNIGLRRAVGNLVLNMGSDNTISQLELTKMIDWLVRTDSHGVSSQTIVEGSSYVARGMNTWRSGRFRSGEVNVIGTPTLLLKFLLEREPYDEKRRYSDDSELCERWKDVFGSHFEISDAVVGELGKASWTEVVQRARIYGISDWETYIQGKSSGWSVRRRIGSILHPLRMDFLTPVRNSSMADAIVAAPFLSAFTCLRYFHWAWATRRGQHADH